MNAAGKKPPVGVIPQRLWLENMHNWFDDPRAANAARLESIVAASLRYRAAGLEPDPAWLEEWTVILTCYLILGFDPP